MTIQNRDLSKAALIVVDVQNDFCPGGALAVADGFAVVPVINKLIRLFKRQRRPVVLTRDWHPPVTSHFDRWPSHCVADTPGAEFVQSLYIEGLLMLSKGMQPGDDAYSGFGHGSPMNSILLGMGVESVYIGGLATDYCVRATAMDAVTLGYNVVVLSSACRAVGDQEAALAELRQIGCEVI